MKTWTRREGDINMGDIHLILLRIKGQSTSQETLVQSTLGRCSRTTTYQGMFTEGVSGVVVRQSQYPERRDPSGYIWVTTP